MQEANKFKLGLFVIASIVVLIIIVFCMGLFDHLQPKAYLVTYVEESVQGLTKGSAVKFRGVPIGHVNGIMIMVDNNEIRIDIEVDLSKIQRRTGSSTSGFVELGRQQFYDFLMKASADGLACRIEPDGITGAKYVEFNFFTDEKAPGNRRKAFFDKGTFVMPSTPSMMANLRTNIFEILTSVAAVDFRGISKQTNELLQRANQTLDRAKLDQLSANADSVIRKLDITVANLNQAMGRKQMQTTIRNIETTLESVQHLAAQVAESVKNANLSGTTEEIRQLSESLKDTSDSLQTSLQKANDTMDVMTDLIRYLNDNPSSLLHGRGTGAENQR